MGRVYELHRPADQAVAAQVPKQMPSMGDAVFFALAIGMRAWVESWMWLLPGVEITPTVASKASPIARRCNTRPRRSGWRDGSATDRTDRSNFFCKATPSSCSASSIGLATGRPSRK